MLLYKKLLLMTFGTTLLFVDENQKHIYVFRRLLFKVVVCGLKMIQHSRHTGSCSCFK